MKTRLDDSFLIWMLKHFKEFTWYYLFGVISLVALNYFQSEIPAMAQNLGELAGQDRLNEVSLLDFLWLSIAILFFRTASRLLAFYPARIQQRNLRNEFVWRLSQTPPDRYKSLSSGQIFQTVLNDLDRIRGFMGFALLQLINMFIALWIFIPKVAQVSPDFLYAYTPFVISISIFSVIIVFFAPLEKKSSFLKGEVQNFIVESYQGRGTLKNFNVEESFIKKFGKLSWSELNIFFKGSLGAVFSVPLIKLSLGASFLWGAFIVYDQQLGASQLIFFSGFLFLLYEPFMFISWVGVVGTSAWAGWKRIKELVSLTEVQENSSRVQCESENEELTIRIWDNDQKITLKKNQKILFCGETGCGKTHTLEQIAFYLNEKKYLYSYVFQEPYLYNDTLEKNLFLGLTPSESQRYLAKHLLEVFYLEDLLEIKDFWDLELGENGKRVSGGQAKRLVIIRSLLSEANILIWDDPFSSVDVVQEKQIFDELNRLDMFKNKYLVISAHRYSSAKESDYIHLIEKSKGVICEGKTQDQFQPGTKVYEYFEKQFI